jgi:hypothetical protein
MIFAENKRLTLTAEEPIFRATMLTSGKSR